MTIDKSIFGLRFGSSEELYPTQEELRVFLESPKREGRRELHGSDLAKYSASLEDVTEFERHQRQNMEHDFQETMFYGALGYSYFFNRVLKSTVEQYKYHLNSLRTLDFKKPTAFIRSAGEEMSRLNPKRRDESVKLAKLQGMVDERKKALETLQGRWVVLAEELSNIALYIRDNLVKIEKLCKTAIGILADPEVIRDEENRLIEDIKTHFKENLKDALHQGQVTKQQLEAAKRDVAVLSREMAALLREDVQALTGLFEVIRDHTKKTVHKIDILTAEIKSKKNKILEADGGLFAQVGQVLISLITDYRFELQAAEIHTETAHKSILLERRKEMLVHLFDLLRKDRRSWSNRRSGEDRRIFNDPNYKDPERRSGRDKRSGKTRRE
ncbi:MAG: hypothetical protein ACM3MD_01650 [Betaproteobacteria bacterium]